MYILQNALKNIARNRGRNIMIGVIIFAIILTTVVALIINNTSAAVIESYKERFASEVSIQPDMQKVMQEAQASATEGRVAIRRPEIESEQLLAFASSEYLKESIATGQIGAESDDIQAIDQDDSGTGGANDTPAMPGGMGMAVSLGLNSNFRLYGDEWTDFNDGMRSLAEDGVSAMPQADNECMISEELAEANEISVGDTLTFTAQMSIDYDDTAEEYSALEAGDTITVNGETYTVSESFMGGRATRDVTFELKVVGIYLDLTDEYANENMPAMASLNRRNEILTTLGTLLAQRKTDESGVQVSVTYYLSDPAFLPQFEAEVRAKGLSDLFTVSADTASYENIVRPVEEMKSISVIFMIVVIVLGAVILLLLCSIAIRERKYEIGVLRAMGMKKAKVAAGLWLEILAITCVCLVVGLGVGAAVAQPVSDKLLTAQVEASQQGQGGQGFRDGPQMIGGMGGRTMGSGMLLGGGAVSNAQPLSEMKITLGANTILEIIAISLALASFAGLVSISKITKYEPIKILMERN